jgi:hypothetical protein
MTLDPLSDLKREIAVQPLPSAANLCNVVAPSRGFEQKTSFSRRVFVGARVMKSHATNLSPPE